MTEIGYNLFGHNSASFSLYGNIKRSIGENPLIDRNPSVLSTALKSEDFQHHYEYGFAVYPDRLKPETYLKSEIGLRFRSYYGKWGAELNGYNYHTRDLIAPVPDGGSLTLKNIGRMRSYGYFMKVDYITRENDWELYLKFIFSQTKSKATAVYGNEPFVKLAGFSDVSTGFTKGHAPGIIYGTGYAKDESGNMLMDQNGKPVVSDRPVRLGDPTPDFIVTFNPSVTYRRFSLNLLWEYTHGGDRWNGTKALLENPDKTYINEDYIEKAYSLRLSDISLKYILNRWNRSFIKDFSIGANAANLWVISSYKGVDPSSCLFGYASSRGLDLFNLPALRSYSIVVTLGF